MEWSVKPSSHAAVQKYTSFMEHGKELGVIQQYYMPHAKATWWSNIDDSVADDLLYSDEFEEYFHREAIDSAGKVKLVSIRQVLHGCKLPASPRQPWETRF